MIYQIRIHPPIEMHGVRLRIPNGNVSTLRNVFLLDIHRGDARRASRMFAYNMLRVGIYKPILSVISIVNRKSSNRKSFCVSTGICYPQVQVFPIYIRRTKNQTQPLPSATRLEQALGRLWSRSVKRSADVRRPQEQDLSERSEFILRGGVYQTK